MKLIFLSKGKISFNNLKRVCKELGENLTDEELQVRPASDILCGECAQVYVCIRACVCVCVCVCV